MVKGRSRADIFRENYKRLREAGFSVEDATRYRGASEENIKRVLKEKRMPEPDPKKVSAGRGEKYRGPSITKERGESKKGTSPKSKSKTGSRGKAKPQENRAERYRENYKRLREAGFSTKEANRYRGASDKNILEAIRTGRIPDKDPGKVKAGQSKGWRKHIENPPEGIQHNITYTLVNPPETKIYNRAYSYKVYFVTRDKDGMYHEKWIIYTSDKSLTWNAIREGVLTEIIEENEGNYMGYNVVISSMTLVKAYFNQEAYREG